MRESRAAKLTEISTAELRERQVGRVTPEELQQLSGLDRAGRSFSAELHPAAASLDYAQDYVFERVSVAHDHEILTEALRGRISHSELRGTLSLRESSGSILRDGDEVATRTTLQRGLDTVDIVNGGLGRCELLGGSRRSVASDRLNPEQKRAVEFVLNTRDRAIS